MCAIKKTLLAGIAVLFLATGTAHAGAAFTCDNMKIFGTYKIDRETQPPEGQYTITIPAGELSRRYHVMRRDRKTGEIMVNGKKCQWEEWGE